MSQQQWRLTEAAALEMIMGTRLEMACDSTGEPCIRLPVRGEGQQAWLALRSKQTRAWIAVFLWDRAKIILTPREIDSVALILDGQAYRNGRIDIDISEAADGDPLLDALITYLHEKSCYDGSCTKLLSELEKTAISHRLNTKCRAWPKGSAQLSRRIADLTPLLCKEGTTVISGRRPGGARFVRLVRNVGRDDAQLAASHESSQSNSKPTTTLCYVTESDADLLALFDQLIDPKKGNCDE